MKIYFCINEVLDQIDTNDDQTFDLTSLIKVSTAKIKCAGFIEDSFTLNNTPKLLDLESDLAINQLSGLFEKVPLFHINMLLLLDSVLIKGHEDEAINKAIAKAYQAASLPLPHKSFPHTKTDETDGLQHPIIETYTLEQLAKIYINFIHGFKANYDAYNFQDFILGKHHKHFLKLFDGFVFNGAAKIRAQTLIELGRRYDHDLSLAMENYVQNGHKLASEMNFKDVHEILEAWQISDNYQMRRCQDIHRLMSLKVLPKTPNWVRTDVFKLLEKEAMKQDFSTQLIEKDPQLSLTAKLPHTKSCILSYAQNQTDKSLKQLVGEVLSSGSGYTGIAEKFVEKALIRELETLLSKAA